MPRVAALLAAKTHLVALAAETELAATAVEAAVPTAPIATTGHRLDL